MTVYGNGNMYLYTGSPDYVTTPSISDNVPSTGATGTQYSFSASASDPMGYSLTYTFNYGDGTGWTTDTTHTYSSNGQYFVTVNATSSTGLTSQSETLVTIGPLVTVEAYDYYLEQWGNYCPLAAEVWVDGVDYGQIPYAGNPMEIALTPGYHTFTFSDELWDPYLAQNAYFYYTYDYNSDNEYNKGDSIPVNPPDMIAAFYYP